MYLSSSTLDLGKRSDLNWDLNGAQDAVQMNLLLVASRLESPNQRSPETKYAEACQKSELHCPVTRFSSLSRLFPWRCAIHNEHVVMRARFASVKQLVEQRFSQPDSQAEVTPRLEKSRFSSLASRVLDVASRFLSSWLVVYELIINKYNYV